jgi:hypothetical protein
MKVSEIEFSERLVKAFFVALEVTGSPTISDAAIAVMLKDLSGYPEEQVISAIRRCCREVKGKLTLADIIQRLDDGRPDPETAWSMVPKDERVSAMMTSEMEEAFRLAYAQVAAGELIPARMTFLEAYRKSVQQARDGRYPVRWTFTPGTDKDGQALVLLDAAEKGRISTERVKEMLPYHREDEALSARLLAIVEPTARRLTAPVEISAAGRKALEQMRTIVGKDKAA